MADIVCLPLTPEKKRTTYEVVRFVYAHISGSFRRFLLCLILLALSDNISC